MIIQTFQYKKRNKMEYKSITHMNKQRFDIMQDKYIPRKYPEHKTNLIFHDKTIEEIFLILNIFFPAKNA